MREDPTSVVPSGRFAYLDNLKVLMVVGVIVAHATFAWTDVGNWVVKEEQLREPALSLVTIVAAIAGLFGLGLFFLIAGVFTPRSLARKGPARFLVDRTVRLGVPMLFFVIFFSPPVEWVDDDRQSTVGSFWDFTLDILVAPGTGAHLVPWGAAALLVRLRTSPRGAPGARPRRASELEAAHLGWRGDRGGFVRGAACRATGRGGVPARAWAVTGVGAGFRSWLPRR